MGTYSNQADKASNVKISIIVPIYNAAKFLRKCLDSITSQTLKEFEVICIGSTDDSLSILEEYVKKDKRLIILQKNEFEEATKNTGIEIAKGEYVGFVNSDSWVDSDYFEKLYNAAVKHNLDIALATNIQVGKRKFKKQLNITDEKIAVSLQDKIDLCQQWKNKFPANKIYKLSMLKNNNITCFCENTLFTIQAIYYANGIVSVPETNYYFRNPNTKIKQLIKDKNAANHSVIKFIKEKNVDLKDKDFWAVISEWRLFGIALWKKRESLYTKESLLFGLPLLTIEDTGDYRIQDFIGGLIHTKKIKSNIKEQKLYKFLGIPVSEKITENDICSYYCFGKLINQFDLADAFFKGHLKKVKLDYDDVYLLHSNSGEIYLFFAYVANAFLKKNGSKNPLFVATKKYHVEILKLYYPQAKYIYINNLKLKTQSDKWVINGHNIYMVFSSNHFQKVEIDIKNNEIGKIHYLNSILKTLNLTKNDYSETQAYISNEIHESLTSKINEIQLKLNNFIILAPEALTCQEVPESFWIKLADKLHQKGYDIFVNAMEQKYKIDGCKSIFLSYQEILCLAQYAKAIISLRSGLTEFLLSAQTPSITIYTKFRKRNIRYSFDVDKTIAGFSILKMPFVSEKKIVEINAEKFSDENGLLNKVLDSLESIINKEESLV